MWVYCGCQTFNMVCWCGNKCMLHRHSGTSLISPNSLASPPDARRSPRHRGEQLSSVPPPKRAFERFDVLVALRVLAAVEVGLAPRVRSALARQRPVVLPGCRRNARRGDSDEAQHLCLISAAVRQH